MSGSHSWIHKASRRALSGLALMVLAGAAVAATPDFTGVWQAIDPPLALRTVDGQEPPLLPAAKKIYEQRKAQLARGDRSFDPTYTRCAPPGEPRILTEDMPFDIFQTSKALLFGYQWNRLVRQINLNQSLDIVSPFYFGTSVGHFDGDKLVVDAEGFNNRFFLDRSGMPHSMDLKLTETYSLHKGGKEMQVRIHVEDPKTFSRAWDTELSFRKLPGARIAEDICTIRRGLVPANLKFFDPK